LSRMIGAAPLMAVCALLCCVAACTAPPRTSEQKEVDKELAARVQDALGNDKMLYGKHIFVEAYNGTVTLTGYVWDPPDILLAQTLAEQVQGVTKVDNRLELQLNGLDDSPVVR
jgi:osmotically-inducible protein OsmY